MTTLIPKFDFKNGGTTPAGAVNRPINEKLGEIVSVKDFGAKGDGTTDDTAAIQAAIDSVAPTPPASPGDNPAGVSGAAVFFPAGTYKVSSTIVVPSYVSLKGEGMASSKITSSMTSGSIVSMGTLATPAFYCVISDLCINGSSQNNTGLSIYCAFWTLYNVQVIRCANNGFYFYNSYGGFGYNIFAYYCATYAAGLAGIYLDGDIPGDGANECQFFGGVSAGCYDGIRCQLGNKIAFYGFQIAGNYRNGITLVNATGVTISNCYFENNATTYAGSSILGTFSFTSIDTNYFNSLGTYETKNIAANGINGTKIINNQFYTVGWTASQYMIGLTDETVSVFTLLRSTIAGNSSPNDSALIFSPKLQTFVNTQAASPGGTNAIQQLSQMYQQINLYGQANLSTNNPIGAGGNQNYGLTFAGNTINYFGIFYGSGVPTLSAAQGSLYMRSDGNSTSTRMYVNTNGTTGWTAVTTAS